jgi:hypothetical protein
MPFEARTAGEVDQGALQFCAALDEGLKRLLGVIVVRGGNLTRSFSLCRKLRTERPAPALGVGGF